MVQNNYELSEVQIPMSLFINNNYGQWIFIGMAINEGHIDPSLSDENLHILYRLLETNKSYVIDFGFS